MLGVFLGIAFTTWIRQEYKPDVNAMAAPPETPKPDLNGGELAKELEYQPTLPVSVRHEKGMRESYSTSVPRYIEKDGVRYKTFVRGDGTVVLLKWK